MAEVCSDAEETGRPLQNHGREQSYTPVRGMGGGGKGGGGVFQMCPVHVGVYNLISHVSLPHPITETGMRMMR